VKLSFRQSSTAATAGALPRPRILIAVISAAATVMLCLPTNASSAQLVWNLTPSAPKGLYRIERNGWNVGDRVVVAPSQTLAADLAVRDILRNGKLLIKQVAAAVGDEVCRQNTEVSVNGRVVARAKVRGSDGALLPSWQGCLVLGDAQVFLLGDTAQSYDGRYFGITSAHDVIGRAILLSSF
jgi:conjugative transfer signal peptidase TraF